MDGYWRVIIVIGIIVLNYVNCDYNDSALQCKYRYNYIFPTVKKFTDYMCGECFYMMGEVETAWVNMTQVENLQVCYTDKTNQETYLCDYTRQCSDYDNCYKLEYDKLNKSDTSNFILSLFSNSFHKDLFLQCCEDAKNCCEKLKDLDPKLVSRLGNRCPAKWDGWMCWDAAEPGTTVWQKCPVASFAALNKVPTECSNEYASKECHNNGTWGVMWIWNHYQQNYYPVEYTNYFTCSTPGATERIRETYTAIAIYILSFIFSIIGEIIFIVYKQYRAVRVQIHLNFFISLTFTCLFSIMFQFLVRERHYRLDSVVTQNPFWCKALLVLTKTSRLANYCWMLIEGVYLHKLIVAAFHEQKRTIYFYLFGWGTPVIIMIPYVIVHSLEQYDSNCWTESMNYPELIYNILPLACITINIVLLVNTVRVLITKLRGSPDHFKAGLRASLVLLPIFGLQYAFYVVPIEPLQTCSVGSFIGRYIQIIIEALQGAIVTTIFCFLNAEVHSHIRRTVRTRIRRKMTEMGTEEYEIGKITSTN